MQGSQTYVDIRGAKPHLQSLCIPADAHMEFLGAFRWNEGALLIVDEEAPQFIIWEQFFCLETLEFPLGLHRIRDYFDYTLENQIKRAFPEASMVFGPGWRYLYPSRNMESGLREGKLNLSAPLIGNAINIRGSNLNELLAARSMIKKKISGLIPIPVVWAYPQSLPVATKDNFLDYSNKKVYLVKIKMPGSGETALMDLSPDEDGRCHLLQHTFQGSVTPVEFNLRDVYLDIRASDGSFRSRRKLHRIRLSYLW